MDHVGDRLGKVEKLDDSAKDNSNLEMYKLNIQDCEHCGKKNICYRHLRRIPC